MNISYVDIVNACTCDAPLTYDHVKMIDNMTHTYSKSFDSSYITMCAEIWKLIGESTHFWSNISMLVDQNNHYETKLQAFVLAH